MSLYLNSSSEMGVGGRSESPNFALMMILDRFLFSSSTELLISAGVNCRIVWRGKKSPISVSICWPMAFPACLEYPRHRPSRSDGKGNYLTSLRYFNHSYHPYPQISEMSHGLPVILECGVSRFNR